MNRIHSLSIQEILKLLPHRFPFLLIDRILKIKKGESLEALKNVSFNEPFFQGHIPNKPIFPGVLILESIAQATGILVVKSYRKLKKNEFCYLAAINYARFKHPVYPGDQIIINVKLTKKYFSVFYFYGIAKVNNKICCESYITCVIS